MTSSEGPGPASTGPGPMPGGPASSVRSHPGVGAPASSAAIAAPSSQATAGSEGSAPPAPSQRAAVARDNDAWAEPVAEAVLACPSVASLSGGPWGTVGTYLPGRRVPGVQITDSEVTVRVVAHIAPLRVIESEVRAVVAALVPGLPVHLGIDDIFTEPNP